jgi:hypothetical protein
MTRLRTTTTEKAAVSLVDQWRAICLQNESGPDSWYVLSNAGMAGCGLSFGVNQFDLNTNAKAAEALARVLRDAKAAAPGLAITEADILAIEAGALDLAASAIAPETEPYRLVPLVNAALATQAGKAMLMVVSGEALAEDVAFLRAWTADLNDVVGGATLLSDGTAAQLLCLDFFNLFGRPTKLTDFLEGRAVSLVQVVVPPVVPPAGVTDLLRYMLLTKQGSGGAADERAEVLRRLNNVMQIAAPQGGWPVWSAKDETWFTTDLADILTTPQAGSIAHNRDDGLYDTLMALAGA